MSDEPYSEPCLFNVYLIANKDIKQKASIKGQTESKVVQIFFHLAWIVCIRIAMLQGALN